MESHLDELPHTGGYSSQAKSKEVDNLFCNSEDLLCQDIDALDLDEATPVDHDEPLSGLEKMAEEEGKKDTDETKTIKMLMEEIRTLKEKISEIELHDSGNSSGGSCQENDEIHASKSTITEKLSSKQEDAPTGYGPYIRYTKLKFKVDTFFVVGSPLGVFLALRNVRIGIGSGKDYWGDESIIEEMPACRQMLNIFHPFDLVAYRVELLVCKDYIDKRPVIVPYHKGGRKLHIGFQEFTEDLSIRSQVIVDNFKSVRVGSLHFLDQGAGSGQAATKSACCGS